LLSIDNVIELATRRCTWRSARDATELLTGAGTDREDFRKSISIENLRDCPPELVQIV